MNVIILLCARYHFALASAAALLWQRSLLPRLPLVCYCFCQLYPQVTMDYYRLKNVYKSSKSLELVSFVWVLMMSLLLLHPSIWVVFIDFVLNEYEM